MWCLAVSPTTRGSGMTGKPPIGDAHAKDASYAATPPSYRLKYRGLVADVDVDEDVYELWRLAQSNMDERERVTSELEERGRRIFVEWVRSWEVE